MTPIPAKPPLPVVEQLSAKWPVPRQCPYCKQYDWNVCPNLYDLLPSGLIGPSVLFGTIFDPAQIIQVVLVRCKTCGHTTMFDALKLGLLDPPKPEPEAATEP